MAKMTKREKYEVLKSIPAVAENAMLMEFIDHELELLDRKNTTKNGEKKLTTKQEENEGVKSEILNYMEMGTKYTVSALLEGVPNQPEDMSHHRMVALLKQLVDGEALTKTKEKGVTYFALTD